MNARSRHGVACVAADPKNAYHEPFGDVSRGTNVMINCEQSSCLCRRDASSRWGSDRFDVRSFCTGSTMDDTRSR